MTATLRADSSPRNTLEPTKTAKPTAKRAPAAKNDGRLVSFRSITLSLPYRAQNARATTFYSVCSQDRQKNR
jgi:hypothetical protein